MWVKKLTALIFLSEKSYFVGILVNINLFENEDIMS
jgi:hypothetical protein